MRRAPILLLCTAVLAACADTPRRNVAAYRAPPVEIGAQGAVLAARLPGEFDGWGLDKAMREGVAAYFARHAPGWQVVDAGRAESPDLELTCTTVRDGISNCADLVVTCDTRRPGKPVASSFVRRFESETCFKGGEVENYRAEAYNHGLAVGEEVAADIAELPDLQAIAGRKDRRRMLDEALATRDPEALDAFAAAHPGTEEAERAETIARGWRAAEAETPEDGTSPDAEGDAAAAPETVAAAASDAAPEGAEAPATTAAAEAAAEPPSEPGAGGPAGAGPHRDELLRPRQQPVRRLQLPDRGQARRFRAPLRRPGLGGDGRQFLPPPGGRGGLPAGRRDRRHHLGLRHVPVGRRAALPGQRRNSGRGLKPGRSSGPEGAGPPRSPTRDIGRAPRAGRRDPRGGGRGAFPTERRAQQAARGASAAISPDGRASARRRAGSSASRSRSSRSFSSLSVRSMRRRNSSTGRPGGIGGR